MNNDIVNWENLVANQSDFQKKKPFKFTFVKKFFHEKFYEKLYDEFPNISERWNKASDHSKLQYNLLWGSKKSTLEIAEEEEDPNFSKEWNEFKQYCHTNEFIENFRKFSGVPVSKVKHFHFISLKKGCFQLPHIHNVGPSTLICMLYFSKDWKEGEPGGTYMAKEEDESSLIFEPYDLDNSIAIFQDSEFSAHGTRYLTSDVERRALQITLEGYDDINGWSGGIPTRKM